VHRVRLLADRHSVAVVPFCAREKTLEMREKHW